MCTAHQIEAAVSNVSKIKLAAADDERRAGGAHAVKSGMLLRVFRIPFVGRRECFHAGQCADRPPDHTVINFANRFYRQPAGLLAALVSPHTIGDYGQPSLPLEFSIRCRFPIKIRILIVLALATDVGEACHFSPGLTSSGFTFIGSGIASSSCHTVRNCSRLQLVTTA